MLYNIIPPGIIVVRSVRLNATNCDDIYDICFHCENIIEFLTHCYNILHFITYHVYIYIFFLLNNNYYFTLQFLTKMGDLRFEIHKFSFCIPRNYFIQIIEIHRKEKRPDKKVCMAGIILPPFELEAN